eukprot:13811435-Ditylum_brightwellii.AAC.1
MNGNSNNGYNLLETSSYTVSPSPVPAVNKIEEASSSPPHMTSEGEDNMVVMDEASSTSLL